MNFKTKNSLLSKLGFFDVMYKPRKQSIFKHARNITAEKVIYSTGEVEAGRMFAVHQKVTFQLAPIKCYDF